MTNEKRYIELLKAILQNASYIKDAAKIILEASLEKSIPEEKQTYAAFAVNYLFAYVDEIGKFYLIKKQYPKPLLNLDMEKIGFLSHRKKLRALTTVIHERIAKKNNLSKNFNDKIIEMLMEIKNSTLYIDYKNGEIIKPSKSKVINPKKFDNYFALIPELNAMATNEFKVFGVMIYMTK